MIITILTITNRSFNITILIRSIIRSSSDLICFKSLQNSKEVLTLHYSWMLICSQPCEKSQLVSSLMRKAQSKRQSKALTMRTVRPISSKSDLIMKISNLFGTSKKKMHLLTSFCFKKKLQMRSNLILDTKTWLRSLNNQHLIFRVIILMSTSI